VEGIGVTEEQIAERAFLRGVECALAVVSSRGDDVLFDEIVNTVDHRALLKVARGDGTLRWSGLSKWLKRRRENGEVTA
jgi:hypothetical protein